MKCWPHLETQCCQRSHLARHEKGQNTVIQRANRFIKNDEKRTDGDTLIPWKHGKCLTWDVTMRDTFAASHLTTTSSQYGSTANSSAMSKTQKYANIAQTHIFTPIAIETTGAMNHQASELITVIGRRITEVTDEVKESIYLFQQVSVAIQRGNMLCFTRSFVTEDK